MAQSGEHREVGALIARADQALSSGNLAQAAVALREASHLEPDNINVKQRWLALQNLESSGNDALQMLNRYLTSGKDEDGRATLLVLQREQLSPDEAAACYAALLDADSTPKLYDQIFGTILAHQIEARKLIALRLSTHATLTFDRVFHAGEESFKALTGVPLDSALWSSKEAQIAAQKDFFRLCVATLIAAGVDHPERAMKAIARQLAADPDSIASLIDQDVFDAVLSALDIRLDSRLKSQAMLSTSKLLEVSKDAGGVCFAEFVASRVAKQTSGDLIVAFSAAAAVFPLLPVLVAKLFMTDGFVQQLVPNLERSSVMSAAGKR